MWREACLHVACRRTGRLLHCIVALRWMDMNDCSRFERGSWAVGLLLIQVFKGLMAKNVVVVMHSCIGREWLQSIELHWMVFVVWPPRTLPWSANLVNRPHYTALSGIFAFFSQKNYYCWEILMFLNNDETPPPSTIWSEFLIWECVTGSDIHHRRKKLEAWWYMFLFLKKISMYIYMPTCFPVELLHFWPLMMWYLCCHGKLIRS